MFLGPAVPSQASGLDPSMATFRVPLGVNKSGKGEKYVSLLLSRASDGNLMRT